MGLLRQHDDHLPYGFPVTAADDIPFYFCPRFSARLRTVFSFNSRPDVFRAYPPYKADGTGVAFKHHLDTVSFTGFTTDLFIK